MNISAHIRLLIEKVAADGVVPVSTKGLIIVREDGSTDNPDNALMCGFCGGLWPEGMKAEERVHFDACPVTMARAVREL